MSEAVLYAEFTARKGSEERVEALILELAGRVRGVDGNLLFEVHRERDEPRRFFVYEVYEDFGSFERQLGAEHNTVFNTQIASLIEEPETQLTWLTPRLDPNRR